jgi:MoxR-like ATPase
MKTTMNTVLSVLCKGFYKREKEVSAMLLAVLSGHNAVFIGPPGTAKTALSNRILSALPKPHFAIQFNAFTEIEDILGPLSVKEFRENDRRIRMTKGYMPNSTYAYIDEIFKAQSSSLNTLLSLLNERKYNEEGEWIETPLISVIASSNERPDDESTALADRMSLFIDVDSVAKDDVVSFLKAMRQMKQEGAMIDPLEDSLFTVGDMAKILKKIDKIVDDNIEDIAKIIKSFNDILKKDAKTPKIANEAILSDRSTLQCAKMLATACFMRGSTKVHTSDAWFFEYLSRSEMYVGLYKGAAAEMLNMQDSLSTLKNRVLGGSRADRIAVETALDNLPFYWQAELKDLLAKSEGRV